MNGTEIWLTCLDGRAVLRWQHGLTLDEATPLMRVIRDCRSLANIRDLVVFLEERTNQKVAVACFPRDQQENRAA
jgi:hypothetical protein